MNFLQSPVWRHIQEIVGKDVFEIKTEDQTYRGVTRTRRFGPFCLRWHQILGVHKEDVTTVRCVVREKFSDWGDIFFQVGIVDQIMDFPLKEKKTIDRDTIKQQRSAMVSAMLSDGWRMSRKENMPFATIRTALQKENDLYASYHREHRRRIRKAREMNFVFKNAKNLKEWHEFYRVRSQMASNKHIGIMSLESFVSMMEYLTETGAGGLYVLMDGHVVAAGSVMIEWEGVMYYVYGAANRDYSSNGAHILLQHLIMIEGYEAGFHWFDHRGVASFASLDHHLAGVTSFKERFGGQQIEFVGNMDLVANELLYVLMKKIKG